MTFSVIDDSEAEADESLSVRFGALPANLLPSLNTAVVFTIGASDLPNPQISLAKARYDVPESVGTVTVLATLSQPSPIEVRASVTRSGSALAGADFNGPATNIIFPPNTTQASLTIDVINDALRENTENIRLYLTAPVGGTFGTIRKTYVYIADDDYPPPAVPPPPSTGGTGGNGTGGGGGQPSGGVPANTPPSVPGTGTLGPFGDPGAPVAVPASVPPPFAPQPPISDLVPSGIGLEIGMQLTDGAISGGLVFFDANRNGVRDFLDLNTDSIQDANEPDEPTGVTRLDGAFSITIPYAYDLNSNLDIDPAEGRFVASGGVDVSTGLPNLVPLSVTGGGRVRSPLTTLVEDLVANGMSIATANDRVVAAFELPDVELQYFNPARATADGYSGANRVLARAAQLQDTVAQIVKLAQGLPDAPLPASVAAAAYAHLTLTLTDPNAIVDLAEPATVEALLVGTFARSGYAEPDAVLTSTAAAVIVAGNAAIDAISATDPRAFLTALAKVQFVAQGPAANALSQFAAGSLTPIAVVNAYTGSGLNALIAAANAGDVITPELRIGDAFYFETDTGFTIAEFTVSLSQPSVHEVSVSYATHDHTATIADNDYEALAGTLSWLPGDTAPRTIQVKIFGDTLLESNEDFLVLLSNAKNAVIADDLGRGEIVADDALVFTAPPGSGPNDWRIDAGVLSLSVLRNEEIIWAGTLSVPVPITIIGSETEADMLTVDLSENTRLLYYGLTFHGGSGLGDSLLLDAPAVNPVRLVTFGSGAGRYNAEHAKLQFTGVENASSTPAPTVYTPVATAFAKHVQADSAATNPYSFSVTFTAEAIDTSTLGSGDIRIVGPNGFDVPAEYVSINNPENGEPRTANFRFVPPGGSWDFSDNGNYSIVLQPNAMFTATVPILPVPAGTIGTFNVGFPGTYTVTTTADSGPGSLRAAIEAANASLFSLDTIQFDPAVFDSAKTIVLASTLSISDSVEILGPGNLTISGANAVRHFDSTPAPVASIIRISGMTLTDGFSAGPGGSMLFGDETITLTRLRLVNNSAASGGAIAATGAATLNIGESSLEMNTATAGGGLFFAGCVLSISSSTIAGNSASGTGGGVLISGHGTALLAFSTVSANIAGSGGGLARTGSKTGISIVNAIVAGNQAMSTGKHDLDFAPASVQAANSAMGSDAGGALDGYANPAKANIPLGTPLLLGPLRFNGGPTRTIAPDPLSLLVNAGTATGAPATDQRGRPRNVRGVDIGAFEVQPSPIASLAFSKTVLTDLQVGPAGFVIVATYSIAMDTSVQPVVLFPAEPVVGSLSFTGGLWLDETHWRANFSVADADVCQPEIDLSIAEGRTLGGDVPTPFDQPDALVIDARNPHLAMISSTSPNGTYITGQSIGLAIDFTEPISLTGTLNLTLDSGAIVAFSGPQSGTRLTGTYLVQAGETSPDLNAAAIGLSGTLTDVNGNAAVLALPTSNLAQNAALAVNPPPVVTSLTLNQNAIQRSRLERIDLAFSAPVDAATLAAPGAILLVRTSPNDSASIGVANGLILNAVSGMIANLTLTFADLNSSGINHGSLADGRWRLSIPSLNYQSPANAIHRLFGDADGNVTVDATDFSFFPAFGSNVASPFDFNDNGDIDSATDFANFGNRFGLSL